MREFGRILNAFCEEITWTNYGGALITILGRDIGFFVIGFLTSLCLEAFIEYLKEIRK